ncbi:MAG: hypothetical protein M0P71_10150 [Melioribacteraceae bacterium]|nr:hypothetical protein [Melioribacteraceae bacterium]
MHIDDKILEKFVLMNDSFSSNEKEEILVHLEKCALCRDAFKTYQEIYTDFDEGLFEAPTENDKELADRIKRKLEGKDNQKLLSGNESAVKIYEGRAEIIRKPKIFTLPNIYFFVKNYPLVSFGFSLVASLAIAFLVTTYQSSIKDMNPVSLDYKKGALQAFNKKGEMIWSKPTGSKSGNENIDSLMNWAGFAESRYINLLDIDGDGKNEVLLTRFGKSDTFKEGFIYCFNNDGTQRWIASPENTKYNYAPNWTRTSWRFDDFFTVKTKIGNKLFVVAHVLTYGGAIVSSLDPETGTVTSSIYHDGNFSCQSHFDIDNDGEDEIILGGTSSYDKPVVVILKTDFLMGEMPGLKNPQPEIKGNALYYIILPVSEMEMLVKSPSPPNVALIIKTDVSGFSVLANERFHLYNKTMQLPYVFDKSLKCIDVSMGNSYGYAYDDYLKDGTFKISFKEYKKELIDSVKYWDGDKFVDHPTKNKYWNQKLKLPK